ncbi:MAG: GntR family transcriptional regulator [Candidatus Acidiferrales bacterium]
MIDFSVDMASRYPAHEQIKEHVRMALAFGELQPGDTLPSIRELGTELDIGPAIVRRAYVELARAGILTMSRSRRIIVNRELDYRHKENRNGPREEVRKLAEQVLKQVLKLGIHPQSFALYLQHRLRQAKSGENLIVFGECNRVQAEQFAADISQAWGVPVRGMDFDLLRRLPHTETRGTRYLCTVPFHYEEACRIARKHKLKVVTVSVHWDQKVLARIASLKPGNRIALIFKKRDHEEYGQLFVRQIESLFPNSGLHFGAVVLEEIEPLEDWLKRGEWQLLFFSNRIWGDLPESVRSRPDVETPTLRPDAVSLEKARLEVGILS